MLLCLIFIFLFCVLWEARVFGAFDYYVDRCGLGFFETLSVFDGVSLLCLLMLFFCGSVALCFSIHYFSGDVGSKSSLGRLLVIFLGVMGGLVCSCGFLGTLIMWEYLGVVSFFLILFYSNLSSLRATLITLFASRFGDVCFFGLIAFLSCFADQSVLFFSFLVLLVVLTKSACFPFISWLLEAMRAPTPVSSLVHSSTLVAAGVWFLFRYGNSVVVFCPSLDFFFFVLGMSTVMVSAFCSMVFLDLKKIVALSTCNNVSWCIVFFLFGDVSLGLFQLLSHGVAKCYLFITLGDLMSGGSSAQDSRGVYCSSYFGSLSVLIYLVLVFSLCGVPFLGIFFSKHGLLCEVLWGYGLSCYVLFFFAFLLSFAYSFRFFCLLCGFRSLGVSSYVPLFSLVVFLSLLSSLLNFFSLSGGEEILLLGVGSSYVLLFIQFLGLFLGLSFYFGSIGRGVSVLGFLVWGCEGLVEVFYFLFDWSYSLFLFLLFRWEAGALAGFFSSASLAGATLGAGWSSLKFLVLSGLFVAGICVFVI